MEKTNIEKIVDSNIFEEGCVIDKELSDRIYEEKEIADE